MLYSALKKLFGLLMNSKARDSLICYKSNPRRIGFSLSDGQPLGRFTLHRIISRIQASLKDFCSSKFEHDVALRVFLVEDMTAVVVESLGASFALPPGLFNAYMKHMGHVRQGTVW